MKMYVENPEYPTLGVELAQASGDHKSTLRIRSTSFSLLSICMCGKNHGEEMNVRDALLNNEKTRKNKEERRNEHDLQSRATETDE